MNDRPSVETTGDTVDEAVAKALAQLGVGPGDVIVEVLEEPSRGIFGIGARPAKVRLQMLRRPTPPPPPSPAPVQDEPAQPAGIASTESGRSTDAPLPESRTDQRTRPDNLPRRERGDDKNRNRDSNRGSRSKPSQPASRPSSRESRAQDDFEYNEEYDAYAFGEVQADATSEDAEISKVVLQELLGHLDIRAEVRVTRAELSHEGENPPYLLNIEGSDVTSLIGRRGETLSSLQYITRLIASRRLGHRANIVVDAGSYKVRRSQKLRELALRMADQAVKESRTVVLEPMPPHERRMIHMALRSRDDVFTKSTGDGDSRKVTIVPK